MSNCTEYEFFHLLGCYAAKGGLLLILKNGSDRYSRNVGIKTTSRGVITQKTEEFMSTAAETQDHVHGIRFYEFVFVE
jgi:hypothetical protein